MKIELRRISHNARLSQETNAFAADIWIDGKKAGTAENAGHGGPTLISPFGLQQQLGAYGKTLPRVPYGHGMDGDFEQSADWIIDSLLETHLRAIAMERGVKRRLSANLVFTKKGQPGIYSIPLKGRPAAQGIAYLESHRTERNIDVILNTIPLAEAIAIYAANEGE